MKKILTALLTVALLLTALLPAAWATQPTSDDIVILYTNDVHCQVDQATNDNQITNIGYAAVAAYKKAMLDDYTNVVLVDAGDHAQGDAIGTLSNGSYLADVMNAAGYDYATFGNHEFDYGMASLQAIINKANYRYLSCNLTYTGTGTGLTGYLPYEMNTYGSMKVAFVGVSTPESFTKSTPTYFQDGNGNYVYSFAGGNNGQDLYTKVQTTVNAAKTAGADKVVLLSHLGIDPVSSPWRSTDLIANITGVDAVIDGHSHSTIANQIVKDKNNNDVVLTSTGTKLAKLGKMTINADTGSITAELVTPTTEDTATKSFITGIEAQYADLLATVVGHTDVALTVQTPDGSKRAVRSAETNLGDLCADAYRAVSGADIAFVNGGGVRDNIAAGDITYEQIIKVHPFGNAMCMVEATGQEIIDALEMGARAYPTENGGFLQVSGLTYNINPGIDSTVKVDDAKSFVSVEGARRIENVKVLNKTTNTYEPIDLTKTYTLASHNYMLKSGGDGINMFTDNKLLLDEVKLDNQVLIEYIRDYLKGNVGAEYTALAGQGRITAYYTTLSDGTTTTYKAGAATPVTVHFDAPKAEFVALYMDNVLVDAANYTVTDGSTVITLAPAYLKTLSVGTHTVRADFTNGTAVSTLTVTAADAAAVSPATADNSCVSVYVMLGLTALLGCGYVTKKRVLVEK